MAAAAAEELVEHALQRRLRSPDGRSASSAIAPSAPSGSRSPSTATARSASAGGRRRAARRSAGTASSAGSRRRRRRRARRSSCRELPPNAVSASAITSTIARRVRSANRRALRAARTSRRSTRRLRVGREDGMSGATVSNDRATFNRGGGGSTHDRSRARLPSSKTARRIARDTIVSMPGPSIPPASRFRGGCSSSGCRSCFCSIWVVAGAVRHVVFIFLVALLIALLLNPLVRGLGTGLDPARPGGRDRLLDLRRRGGTRDPRSRDGRGAADAPRQSPGRQLLYGRVRTPPATGATHDLARFQRWLDTHHLKRVRVQKQGQKFLDSIGTKDVEKYTTKALNWAEGAGLAVVGLLFSVVLVIVVSVYMLLDMHRLAARRRPALSTAARHDAAHRADGAARSRAT